MSAPAATARTQAGALRAVIEAFGDQMPTAARAQLSLIVMGLEQLARSLDAASSPGGRLPPKFDRRRH